MYHQCQDQQPYHCFLLVKKFLTTNWLLFMPTTVQSNYVGNLHALVVVLVVRNLEILLINFEKI